MIVRSLKERIDTQYDVKGETWRSVRLLLKEDQMGFSFHITTITAGTETKMWYKHHLESVFCIEGTGSIQDLASGKSYAIEPGVIYALDRHDRHILKADTELKFACVFNPPCTGQEVHDEDGAYTIQAEVQDEILIRE